MSVYFTPVTEENSYPYASISCYTTTNKGDHVFNCQDIKVKFICKDKMDYNMTDGDYYGATEEYSGDYGMEYMTTTSTVSYDGYTNAYAYDGHSTAYQHYDMTAAEDHHYDMTAAEAYPTSEHLSTWEKAEIVNEAKTSAYHMVMESYSCRILWMEHFQHDLYTNFDRQKACSESVDEVLYQFYCDQSSY